MWIKALFLVLLALLAGAQIVADSRSAAVYFLGYSWNKAPWDGVGSLELSFYVRERQIGVRVSVEPLCDFVRAVGDSYLDAAGHGVVRAAVAVQVGRFNATCPLRVFYSWRYVEGPTLGEGDMQMDSFQLYVPPKPEVEVRLNGTATYGAASVLDLVVAVRGIRGGYVRIDGDGVKILSPSGEIPVSGVARISINAVAVSNTAALILEVGGVDQLGGSVNIRRAIPVRVAPPPRAYIAVEPGVLWRGLTSRVNVTVRVPGNASGVAYIKVSGGSTSASVYPVDIIGGAGRAVLEIYPTASSVLLQAEIYYQAGSLARDEAQLELPVKSQTSLARIKAEPGIVYKGVLNYVKLRIEAPGNFKALLSVQGAAANITQPFALTGSRQAEVVLSLWPLGNAVSIRAELEGSNWTDVQELTLPAAEGGIIVKPLVGQVDSGGVATVPTTIIYTGGEPIAATAVFSSPSTGFTAVFALNLTPYRPTVINLTLPIASTYTGPLQINYEIFYASQHTMASRVAGSFYITATQRPKLEIVSVDISPKRPEAGKPVFVILTVYNSGYTPAYNIKASATGSGTPITGAVQITGRLDPQRDAAISFGFNATNPFNLTISLTYEDSYGKTYETRTTVRVDVAEPSALSQPSGEPYGLAALAAVAIAVLAVAVITSRRRGRRRGQ